MGHGENAKFFAHAHAAYLRGTLLSLSESNKLQPVEVLSSLSDAITTDSVLNTTLLTCLGISLNKNHIAIASAGHPPAIGVDIEDTRHIQVDGGLLALSNTSKLEQKQITLKSTERLLLYSDGLFDAVIEKTQQVQYQKECLHQIRMDINPDLTIAADEVMKLFDRESAGSPRDDATLILIEHEQRDYKPQ